MAVDQELRELVARICGAQSGWTGAYDEARALAKRGRQQEQPKCPECDGTGVSDEHDRSVPPNHYVCEKCGGSGKVVEGVANMMYICPSCGGHGWIVRGESTAVSAKKPLLINCTPVCPKCFRRHEPDEPCAEQEQSKCTACDTTAEFAKHDKLNGWTHCPYCGRRFD